MVILPKKTLMDNGLQHFVCFVHLNFLFFLHFLFIFFIYLDQNNINIYSLWRDLAKKLSFMYFYFVSDFFSNFNQIAAASLCTWPLCRLNGCWGGILEHWLIHIMLYQGLLSYTVCFRIFRFDFLILIFSEKLIELKNETQFYWVWVWVTQLRQVRLVIFNFLEGPYILYQFLDLK